MLIDFNDKRQIGKTKESISVIGLGTWAVRDYKKALRTFVYALTHGIDNIDTAEMYGNGETEKFVGEVVKEVGRDNIFITTKMLPDHLTSKDNVLTAAKMNLRRLNIDCVDLFLIHWPNRSIPIEVQVKNFEIVYLEGCARYIGVSNFSVKELEMALFSTKKAEIVVNQVHYSVLNKQIERDLLPYCIEQEITIQAYSPLERGKVKNNSLLERIGKKYGKSPVQVALNYLISHPRVIAIPKTEELNHLTEIMGSMGWRLKLEDIKLLGGV
ncbi:MAG: aldo/keto reductase [Archaeoglobaceae archaeon]|nr:aldo/keto reductase [Archaeoglobaceae archaeon]